jgi:hypothetical protein
MRTTVDIAEDVLYAAKEIARQGHKSLGEVLSTYCRSALLAGRLPSSPSPLQLGAVIGASSAHLVLLSINRRNIASALHRNCLRFKLFSPKAFWIAGEFANSSDQSRAGS